MNGRIWVKLKVKLKILCTRIREGLKMWKQLFELHTWTLRMLPPKSIKQAFKAFRQGFKA